MKPTHVLHCSMVGIKRKGGVSQASFSGSQHNAESMRCSAARRGYPPSAGADALARFTNDFLRRRSALRCALAVLLAASSTISPGATCLSDHSHQMAGGICVRQHHVA